MILNFIMHYQRSFSVISAEDVDALRKASWF